MVPPMTVPMTDRDALMLHRKRADAMFLQLAAIEELQDRVAMVNRTFTSQGIVTGFADLWRSHFPDAQVIEDTDTLPLQPKAHDLILHGLALHWANDPVGQLIQCRHALRPDGLFIGICFGGQTLHELRSCLSEAEVEVTGGLSPRVAPMAEIRDLGGLLQRAGFALPVTDVVPLRVAYNDMVHLMRDLRAMGESNALNARLKTPTKRQVFDRAAELYQTNFGTSDSKVLATFELIVLTGWAPSETQPKPLRPGSAQQRLADALKTEEKPLSH